MWQQIIVAVIVVVALGHFCTKYLPVALRKRMVYVLSKRGFDHDKLAKLFKTQGGGGCGDGGGCSSCGSCETTPPAKADSSSSSTRRVIKLHVQR